MSMGNRTISRRPPVRSDPPHLLPWPAGCRLQLSIDPRIHEVLGPRLLRRQESRDPIFGVGVRAAGHKR